jgi:hypothetical protein
MAMGVREEINETAFVRILRARLRGISIPIENSITSGFPDLFCAYNNKIVLIEAKAQVPDLRPKQRAVHHQLIREFERVYTLCKHGSLVNVYRPPYQGRQTKANKFRLELPIRSFTWPLSEVELNRYLFDLQE